MFEKPAVIAALGNSELNNIIREMDDVNFVFEAQNNYELKEQSESERADTIISSWKMHNVLNALLLIKKNHKKLRIIYITKELTKTDHEELEAIKDLYHEGIYDIVFCEEITEEVIKSVIHHRKGPAAMAFLSDAEEGTKASVSYSDAYNLYPGELNNLTVFMSMKPGSGKTYLAVNTACMIAKNGTDNPRVALLEADLETPSVGTALAIDQDGGKNIKSALDAVKTLFNGNNLMATEKEQENVRQYVRNCFVKYKAADNLFVLQGTSMMPEDLENYKALPSYYMFILEAIREYYDLIIVDLNSSILGTSTYPFLKKANKIICTVTMDANCIRQTLKYRKFLEENDFVKKITWVMTKTVENTKEFNALGSNVEKLIFTPKDFDSQYFPIKHKIPAIPETVFINHLYNGEPVILDDRPYTKSARDAIGKLANEIHTVNLEVTETKKGKRFFAF